MAAAIASLHAAARLAATAEVPDAIRLDALEEMEQMLFKEVESLETRGEPVDDLLKDLLAASAGIRSVRCVFQQRF